MIGYFDAVDEIFGLLNVTWNINATAIVGYVPDLFWDGVEDSEKPDYSKFWARLSQQTDNEAQSTLRNDDCGQRYRTTGTMFVQIFCPKSNSQSMEFGRKLAIVARDAYRGKKTTGGIWFRNARVKELSPEKKWNRLNVMAAYEYDEIG